MQPDESQAINSWLQAILKEVQETKAVVAEMRPHVTRTQQDSGDSERKIDETRNVLESKIDKLEAQMNEIRSVLNDIRNKVDRIK